MLQFEIRTTYREMKIFFLKNKGSTLYFQIFLFCISAEINITKNLQHSKNFSKITRYKVARPEPNVQNFDN